MTWLISHPRNLITGSYQVKTAKLRVINAHRNSEITKKQTKNIYAVYAVSHRTVAQITEYSTTLRTHYVFEVAAEPVSENWEVCVQCANRKYSGAPSIYGAPDFVSPR